MPEKGSSNIHVHKNGRALAYTQNEKSVKW